MCLLISCGSSDKSETSIKSSLEGTWEVSHISGSNEPFTTLFPGKKPIVKFEKTTGSVLGNTGCNNFYGQYKITGKKLAIGKNISVTEMFCSEGMEGERIFLTALAKSDGWDKISSKTLELKCGGETVMRLVRK